MHDRGVRNAAQVALGTALEARVAEVARGVLETWHKRAPTSADRADARVAEDIIRTTELSTIAVVKFLLHGELQSREQAQAIAATGKAPLRDSISLSDLTKLYLYWRDLTIQVLRDEAVRLDIGAADLDQAIAAVRVGSDGSIVRMAKQFDAERERLQRELGIEQARLAHQAFHDSLTGLPNRRLFFDRLAHALARTERSGRGVGLLFIDIDEFKSVNDTYGHAAGDKLLVAVAERLRDVVRQADTVARLGGDEFVILCEDTADPDGAPSGVLQRICGSLAEPCVIGAHDIVVSVSSGIAVAAPHMDADTLVRLADQAMYAAKRARRTQRMAEAVAADAR